MNFIQSRCHVKDSNITDIAQLLATLSSCSHKAFATSIKQKIKPNDLTEWWCRQNNVYANQNGDSLNNINLTSHQKNMVARNAKNLRNTANAKSQYLSGHYQDLALACKKAITKKSARLKSLELLISLQNKEKIGFEKNCPEVKHTEEDKTEQADKADLTNKTTKLTAKNKRAKETPAILKANVKKAAILQLALNSMANRHQRLISAQQKHHQLAQNGLSSICFGSKRLASAVHKLNEDSSPYPNKKAWLKTWREARNQSWLFEGNKNAKNANPNVKWNKETSTLKIRLTDDQALKRMKAHSIKNGIPLAELLNSNKLGHLRMACRYIEIHLEFNNQDKKLSEFLKALTPNNSKLDQNGHLAKKTQPCDNPISWRVWIEGDPTKPQQCKLYARAQWQDNEIPTISSSLNGCIGIDINMWGISTAYCDKNGNKPSVKSKILFVKDYPMNWTGAIKGKDNKNKYNNKTSEQIIHEVRVIAKKVVNDAAKLGVPIALECLDFSKKKIQLRYENKHKNAGERAQRLSSFAYQKLIESIVAKANKVGVEIRFVDPSWTSVVGWAKYGVRLGLNVDQAAAFTIARRAIVSKGKHIKRAKRNADWIDLYAKAEKVDDFRNNQHVLETETKDLNITDTNKENKDLAIEKISNPLNNAPTPIRRFAQQSMSKMMKRKHLVEYDLADILGQDRKIWAVRLKKAAIQCGQSNLANRRRFNLQDVSLSAL